MAIVPLQRVYVVANFKETQLTHVVAGQPVDMVVDTFPDDDLRGRVDNAGAGDGMEFSLLPPDNATGNFTKIVQRIPVKIVFGQRTAGRAPPAGHVGECLDRHPGGRRERQRDQGALTWLRSPRRKGPAVRLRRLPSRPLRSRFPSRPGSPWSGRRSAPFWPSSTSRWSLLLADIQGALGAGADEGGWITTAYLVAEIIVIPISGWLARVFFSLRTYLLTNTFLFLVLTVACAFTTDLGQMIVVRAMQGFAGGVLIPLAFSIIITKLPVSKHPIGLSIYAITAIFAPAIGPVIGGYCNENFGWQSIFFVNLLPGAVMFAMLWFSLDREPRQFGLLRQGDWLGIATIAVGLGCLETVLEEGNKDDWFGSAFIVRLTIVAIVSLRAFIVIQLVRKQPLLHLELLGRRNFGLGTVAELLLRPVDVRLDLYRAALPLPHPGL